MASADALQNFFVIYLHLEILLRMDEVRIRACPKGSDDQTLTFVDNWS